MNYVDNAELKASLAGYRPAYLQAKSAKQGLPTVPLQFAKAIEKIATRYALRSNFSGYSYVDEMISDAVLNCIHYAYSFDGDKYDNPFAYFTSIVHSSFIQRIAKEHQQEYIKCKIAERSGAINNINHRFSLVVADYEAKLEKKREHARNLRMKRENAS